MRMMKKKYGAAVVIALTAMTLNGQNLKKEITVVHDYEPEYVAPTPLSVSPAQVSRDYTLENLTATQRKLNLPPTSMLTQLRPSSIGDTLFDSQQRGYASLAFMVRYNLALSAGYKVLDTDRIRLNAWLQYDGRAYKADRLNKILRSNSGVVGAIMRYAIDEKSAVDASVAYNYAQRNMPWGSGRWIDAGAHKLNLDGTWSSETDKWSYGAGLYYQWASMPAGLALSENNLSATEHKLGIKAYSAYGLGENSLLRLDAGWKYHAASAASGRYDASWSDLVLNPVYTGSVDKVDLRLGMKLVATFNGGSDVLVAPDVNVTWHTSDYVKLYALADGVLMDNGMANCYYAAPYALPGSVGGFTSMPINLRGGLVFGPRSGVRAEVFGGYMTAGNLLMPAVIGDGVTTWLKINMQGWYAGVKAGYNYKHIVDLSAEYRIAPQEADRGLVYDIDRARHCLDVKVLVTPIKSVDFTAGWHLRADRAVLAADGLHGLGSVSDVYISGLYRINKNWSMTAQVSNLLNHKYDLIGGLPAQGITGLVGFTYKF